MLSTGTVNAKGDVSFTSAVTSSFGGFYNCNIIVNGTSGQVVTFGGGGAFLPKITLNNSLKLNNSKR